MNLIVMLFVIELFDSVLSVQSIFVLACQRKCVLFEHLDKLAIIYRYYKIPS